MDRLYLPIVEAHFQQHEQMLFLAGPRQVGKTTIAKQTLNQHGRGRYFNFDIDSDRELILSGADSVARSMNLDEASPKKPLLILDEIHKYKHWKNFLKGLYDKYGKQIHILVTGSAKLTIFQRGGDSLMGRYLLYRIHPLSVAEILDPNIHEPLLKKSKAIQIEQFDTLQTTGGYPNPFLKNNPRFSRQWHHLRKQQLFREDIQTVKQIQDIQVMEVLASLIQNQVGQQLNYSNLAKSLKISNDTVSRWITTLEQFYYCFRIQPWFQNVKRSLVKEPKVYLWDWSECKDVGQRAENLIASHLYKAVHFWTDHGLGEFSLHYLRDKNKREVDFIVVKDQQPWFLVEVKHAQSNNINSALKFFQDQVKAQHAFQVVINKPFEQVDCFSYNKPVIIPAMTLLSQLI